MIRRLTNLCVSLTYYVFSKVLTCFNSALPGTFTTLLYHEVTTTHREKFNRQLVEIKRASTAVAVDFNNPLEQGNHFVAVCFDDSFLCISENALPELLRLKIPFTIFVPTAFMGTRQGWLKNRSHPDYHEVVSSADMIKTLDTELVLIGSHTHSHQHLTDLAETEIIKELDKSKQILESITCKKINLIAYPYGEYSDTIIRLSKESGYTRAFSVVPNLPFSDNSGFVSGRVDASPDDWPLEFWLKIRGAYQWLSLASLLKRKLTPTGLSKKSVD